MCVFSASTWFITVAPAARPTPQGGSLTDGFSGFIKESHRDRAGGGDHEPMRFRSEAEAGGEPGREDRQGCGGQA